MDLRPLSEIPDDKLLITNEKGQNVSVTPHDADTYYTDTGLGKRIVGFDAAEVPKITETGGFSVGSSLGLAQSAATKQVLKDYGFNREVVVGKDEYKRDLVKLVNPQGETAENFLLRNRIVQPTKYTSDKDMIDRSFQIFQDAMIQHDQKTPVQKARELVESTLSSGTMVPRVQANTVEEFQDYTKATSNKGLAQQEQMIKDLEKRIQSPKINELQKQQYINQLNTLKQSYQTNLNIPKNMYVDSLEGFRQKGAYGTMAEFGRALDLGWIAVDDSAANFLQWSGDLVKSKSLMEYGKDWEFDNKRARRLVDISAGDRDITGGTVTSLDDVEKDFSKVFKFLGTSVLQYGPQMAVMIGGSIAGGLAGGPAGAFIVPMAMGIADVYGEMPDNEKNPEMAAAIGSAVGLVDRFGFAKGAIKGSDLLTKKGLAEVSSKIAASKGISVPEATNLLHKEMISLTTDYALIARTVAADQLASKQNLLDLMLQINKSAGKEALTEAIQESIQYAGIRGTSTLDFDWSELYKRTKEAAIVGGILGGTFSAPGAMMDRSNFNQQLNMLAGIETRPLTNNTAMEQEEIARNGTKLDDVQLANKLRNYSKSGGKPVNTLADLITPGTTPNTLWQDFTSLLTNGGLFSQTRDNNLAQYAQYEGGREIAGLFDANSVRGVYSGMSPFKRIHSIANSVMSLFPNSAEKRKLFNTDNNKDIGEILLESYNNGLQHQGALAYRAKLDTMGQALADTIDGLGNNTGWSSTEIRQPDFFLKNQIVDPNLVRANADEFIKAIEQNYVSKGFPGGKVNRTFLEDLATRISENMTYREMKDLKDLGMLDSPVLNKFRSKDVEHNATRLVEMVSRSAVKNTIFGANGEVVAKGIAKMLDAKQITEQEASQLAMNVDQMIKSFDGNLNQPTNPMIKGATDNLTFTTMMVYMDTSLFANLAEIVYGALGLSPKQMVKYFGLVGKEFASDIVAKFAQAGNKMTGGKIPSLEEREMSKNVSMLQHTGHFGKMNDIAFNVGANINTQAKRNLSKIMFKFNLVESATNAARAARGAIASDEINHLTSIIAESPNNNDLTRWARDRLSYYRMDPDKMVDLYNQLGQVSVETLNNLSEGDPLYLDLANQLTNGITNFIDEFSARPEPGSSAKLFDDRRFDLFTQFKKFTWHFTANIIPQMWNMYIKRGDVKYSYSTFSLLMLSFAMAYAGMYMKSMLRGEEIEDDEVKFNKRLKQAFDYSVGGAYTDVLNTVTEATAERPDGSLKNSPFKTAVSQSPSINLLFNTGKDVYKVATEEEDAKAKTNLIRRIPVFGEIPAIRDLYVKEK